MGYLYEFYKGKAESDLKEALECCKRIEREVKWFKNKLQEKLSDAEKKEVVPGKILNVSKNNYYDPYPVADLVLRETLHTDGVKYSIYACNSNKVFLENDREEYLVATYEDLKTAERCFRFLDDEIWDINDPDYSISQDDVEKLVYDFDMGEKKYVKQHKKDDAKMYLSTYTEEELKEIFDDTPVDMQQYMEDNCEQ